MKDKLLLVEDEQDLGNVVKQYLELMDFEVVWCLTAEQALEEYFNNRDTFDMLIIDVQLPGIDGFELVKKINDDNNKTPFLFLTARNEKKDRIFGLKIGGDDYINKPFDIDELVLRIKNIIKRRRTNAGTYNNPETNQDLIIGDVVLHMDTFKLSVNNGKKVSLTQRESELLVYLYKNKNHVLKREQILLELWGENDYFLGRSLDVFISRLRKLLASSLQVKIENVYGVGFILNLK